MTRDPTPLQKLLVVLGLTVLAWLLVGFMAACLWAWWSL